jgi:hypothetical protein
MNGTVCSSIVSVGFVTPDWSIAGTGEFTGDGSVGIVWQNTETGERGIWLMDETAYAGWLDLDTVPIEWSMVGGT